MLQKWKLLTLNKFLILFFRSPNPGRIRATLLTPMSSTEFPICSSSWAASTPRWASSAFTWSGSRRTTGSPTGLKPSILSILIFCHIHSRHRITVRLVSSLTGLDWIALLRANSNMFYCLFESSKTVDQPYGDPSPWELCVTRLGYFWKVIVAIFLTKVAQIYDDF